MSRLSIAIVGHSNAGKTSLVAALTRDARLRITETPGTTRQHYEKVWTIAGEEVIGFIDTPGFETARAINDLLDAAEERADDQPDGRALVDAFLGETATDDEFAMEKEALRGAIKADLLAYVADVQAEPRGQSRQEVRLLRRLGVPIVAVLNVLSEEDHREAWETMFRREHVDMVVPLDAHAFARDQEARFYQVLALVHPQHEARFERVTRLRDAQRKANRNRSARTIAEMLLDCLAFRLESSWSSRKEALKHRVEANERFKRLLRQRERICFSDLSRIYGFGGLEVDGDGLEVGSWSGDWRGDLFDPQALKRYGASAGSLALAGAITGSLLDGVGGMGIGTALGGGLGAAAGLLLGRRVSTSVDGAGLLTVGPVDGIQFPSVLLNRAVDCWGELEARSHARQDDLKLPERDPEAESRLGPRGLGRLARLARRIRRRGEWSGVEAPARNTAERARTLDELAELVESLLP